MDGKYMKGAFRKFIMFFLIAAIALSIMFGFYWYSNRNFGERGEYKERRERCEKIVSGEVQGDLTDYSECTRFLKWFEKNSTLED